MSSVGDFCRCAVLLQIPSLHSKKYAELVNSLVLQYQGYSTEHSVLKLEGRGPT